MGFPLCEIPRPLRINETMKKFSIIIPAWNEEEYVGAAIGASRAQDYPRDRFEIIVVDNNSADKTSMAARKAGADKVVLEPEQGTNMARNRGVEEAEGEILAFLDADCIPPPEWLRHLEENLSKRGVAATSGPYDLGFAGIRKYMDLLYTHFLFWVIPMALETVFRKKAGVIIGGNFAMKRSTMDVIGEFPRYRFFGDDTAIATLIARKVGRVWYDTSLTVKSSPRRLERHGLLTTAFRYAFHFFKVYFEGVSDTMKSKWDPNRPSREQ